MRKMFVYFLGAFLILLTVVSQAQESKPQWYQDWDLADRARSAKNQPLLVYFFNNTARGCKLMQEDTFTDPEVASRMHGVVLLALNEQKSRDLAKKMNIFRVPTIVLYDAMGKEVDRATGYKDPSAFKGYLENVIRASSGKDTGPVKFAASNILEAGARTTPILLRYSSTEARTLSVVGDFNDWRLGATPMIQTGPHEWTLTVNLYPGIYEYLFYLNDAEYKVDPRNPLKKANPYGGSNSVLIIGDAKYSPMISSGGQVTFILYNTEAQKIELAGSFNNWTPLEMFRKADDPGMWGVRLILPPGVYTYKYLIDGEWTCDPENYWPIDDQEGHINSSFTVQ